MSSGLRSIFSRPRKTNGSTPNAAGVFTTPTEKFADFSSPAVNQVLHAGFHGTPEVNNIRYTQVRTARQQTRPLSPASSTLHSTPISARLSGSTIDLRLRQSRNARLPMVFILLGTITL